MSYQTFWFLKDAMLFKKFITWITCLFPCKGNDFYLILKGNADCYLTV